MKSTIQEKAIDLCFLAILVVAVVLMCAFDVNAEIHCAEQCLNVIPETGNVLCHQACYDDLVPPQNTWYQLPKTPIPTINPTAIATHTEVAEMLRDFLK